MPSPSIQCPHCGAINWDAAPVLKETLDLVRSRKLLTSRDVAIHFGLSPQNAYMRMTRLESMGFVQRGPRVPQESGGYEILWKPIA